MCVYTQVSFLHVQISFTNSMRRTGDESKETEVLKEEGATEDWGDWE